MIGFWFLLPDQGISIQFPRYESMAAVMEAISVWEAKPEEVRIFVVTAGLLFGWLAG